MAEGSPTNNNNEGSSNRGSGFRWSLQRSLDPHLNAAAETPRRLREDLHQVIRGLSPLVARPPSVTLSSWLRNPRSHVRTSSSEALAGQQVEEQSSAQSNRNQEFVITVDQVSQFNNAGASSSEMVGQPQQPSANNAPPTNEASNSQQSDILPPSPELRSLISLAEKYLPFLFILFAKLIFDHKTGIIIVVGLIVNFTHSNAVIKREVRQQNKKNYGSLFVVAINLITCTFFIYYVFEADKLHYYLIFMMPTQANALAFWDLLWIVGITDFVLKSITILCKIVIIALPPQVIPFQKKGKYYLFIEQTSQLYRSFMPIQPWLCYLYEAYEGAAKIFGILLCLAYVLSKGKEILKKTTLWKTSLSKLMMSVTYGTSPTKEQLEVTGNMCPICQDDYRHPTMLQCKHIFCEECVVMWFDRERTCPMCRAQIADDPSWRDGATTFFFQVF